MSKSVKARAAKSAGEESDESIMRLDVEIEREDDGRWIAEIPELPGVMAYGATRDDARRAAVALALRVIADRLDHGELVPSAVLEAFAA